MTSRQLRILACAVCLSAPMPASQGAAKQMSADILVVGATSAGIASALNAADLGHSVILTEESSRIGGLLAGGLSYTDFRAIESVQGAFRDYMERVEAYYRRQYGPDSQQVRDCFHGAHAEPKVSLMILQQMLAERSNIRVLTRMTVVKAAAAAGRITQVEMESLSGQGRLIISAKRYIDAAYEGDLAAAAGVEYRVGRESVKEFGERLAGHIYFRKGVVLYGGTGAGDKAVQCYNFRVTMTDRPDNRLPVPRPARYDRREYLRLIPLFTSGTLKKVFTVGHDGILREQRIPNGKADINDINTSPVGFGLPGENFAYPEGNREVRQKIYERHRDYAQGLLYFLQNDPELPAAIREDSNKWGLCRDEFEDTAHFPSQLYIREARRIVGQYIFTQADVELAPGLTRTRLQPASIAVADYPLNSHGVKPAGSPYEDVREGYLVYGDLPFQVPYGVIVPKTIENLLVPVAVSSSHVGFSALRMEPTWTAMGQAAGAAAHLSLARGIPVQKVSVPELQSLLIHRGAATIFLSDVPRTHPRFALLQELGNLGFFHEPADPSFVLAPRKLIYGIQYFDPPERHGAELNSKLTEREAARWTTLLKKAGKAAPGWKPGMTRGEYIGAIPPG